MNYHTPVTSKEQVGMPDFMVHNNELICPKKLFTKKQYPNLPFDMVKVTGMNGQSILIPYHKLKKISSMDM